MNESPDHLPNPFKDPRVWLTKILGSSVIVLVLLVLALVGGGGFLGYRLWLRLETKLEKLDRTQDVLVTDIKVLSEQSAVRAIVEAHCKGLSPDQTARVAFEIYDACHRHMGYPLYIPLGLIAKESSWNPNARGGDAIGLMQVRPSTAMAHFRALGVAFSPAALFDPVMNVTIGLRIMFDCQDAAVQMGWSPRDQYVRGLYDYNGGGESYARLVMTQAVPYQKALDAPVHEQAKPVPVELPNPVKARKGHQAEVAAS